MVKLLIGGSPCTYWSVLQAPGTREVAAEGLGWELFKNFLIAKEKFKPDYFLYENNKSASAAIKAQIETELGEKLMYINSALVSAQNRNRFYVFNWRAEQPQDRKIKFADIIESGLGFQEKAYTLTTRCGNGAIIYDTLEKNRHTMIAEKAESSSGEENATANQRTYLVKSGNVTMRGKTHKIDLPDGFYKFRQMTVRECERLQTMPDYYTKAASKNQAYKMLGNGWTAEVIKHLIAAANIPLDEEIIVLSMYDGMGTGRYVLDNLGYKNVKYFAYEIDKPAISVAVDNYPDIIQMGDAFEVRKEGWALQCD